MMTSTRIAIPRMMKTPIADNTLIIYNFLSETQALGGVLSILVEE